MELSNLDELFFCLRQVFGRLFYLDFFLSGVELGCFLLFLPFWMILQVFQVFFSRVFSA